MQNSLEHTELNLLRLSLCFCLYIVSSLLHFSHTKLLVSRSSQWNSAEKYFSLSWQLLTCGRQPARVSLPPLSAPLHSPVFICSELNPFLSPPPADSHSHTVDLTYTAKYTSDVESIVPSRWGLHLLASSSAPSWSILHKLPDTLTVLQPSKRQQPSERTWAAFMEHLLLLNCHVSSNQVKRANKVFVYRGFLQLAWNSTKQSLWAMGVCIQNFWSAPH